MSMEFKQITEKQKIPSIGLGTWGMGGKTSPDVTNDDHHIRAIQYAIKIGITHIDTAEMYAAGHAEELVGEAIRRLADRKKLFITTKVSPMHLSYDKVLNSCKQSLKRLNTNYIDLYLIHWPNPLANMKNVMAAFDRLVSEKQIRFVGVSNFSTKQLQNAQKYSQNKIVCDQVEYNLLNLDPEKELLSYCQKEKIILTAYSPLAQGGLVGNRYDLIDRLSQKYNKTHIQICLRYLIDQPQVITIPKSSSREHLDEIIGTLGWHLEESDILEIKKEFGKKKHFGLF